MAYTFKHGDRPLDDYTIQRAVGAGGFGEVYYAVSDGGREVALKYLHQNPQVELRGVSHCINLKSPHLVSIFDVKKNAEGQYIIVMEYCSGPSLRDLLIAEPNGLGPQKAAFFVREIAKGLSYLHDRGIVHRDLKPGNIFYDDGYVKIGDYGLSKFISVSRHSAQTASVGTVHYMAPEIGSGNYSRGIDIYALGVMLYEMLLGRVPFEGSSMGEVLMKHLTSQPAVDDLPEPFGRVIRKALAKDPKDRYATVSDMVDELLAGEEVEKSLAGFAPQSLNAAVARGGLAPADSPMPSPNPMPGYARDFDRPASPGHGPPPPPGDGPPVSPVLPRRRAHGPPLAVPLSPRLAQRMERVSSRIEKRMARLAGRRPPRERRPHRPHGRHDAAPVAAVPVGPRAHVFKRRMLCAVVAVGGSLCAALLAAIATNHEAPAMAAGLATMGMFAGISGSSRLLRRIGMASDPRWSQGLVRLLCTAPLVALGMSPMLAASRWDDAGLAVLIGLGLVVLLGDWGKERSLGAEGQLRLTTAAWTAFGAVVATLVACLLANEEPDAFVMVSGTVAATVSLLIQATTWWMHGTAGAGTALASPAAHDAGAGADATPAAQDAEPRVGDAPAAHAAVSPPHAATAYAGPPYGQPYDPGSGHAAARDPRVRWGATRAFWGVVAFILMGGGLVTLLIACLAGRGFDYDKRTGVVLACIACGSVMTFALRKTTAMKRIGFWRETLRPMLITVTLFCIGAAITGLARYQHVWRDEAIAGCITGLVMSSLLFLFLVAL
ncbi:MAG: serine/threonine-protein kinase, partial [Phycisphaerae bacterium]